MAKHIHKIKDIFRICRTVVYDKIAFTVIMVTVILRHRAHAKCSDFDHFLLKDPVTHFFMVLFHKYDAQIKICQSCKFK
jgi:hypothetical protein